MKTMFNVTTTILIALAMAIPTYAAPPLLEQLEQAFVGIGESVRPWVVQVEVEGERPNRAPSGAPESQDPLDDLRRFFGVPFGPDNNQQRRLPAPVASGSGFIYDKQGHIITNNHVIDNAKEVKVRLSSGEELVAEVVGTDSDTDIAVLKVDTDIDLPSARLGDSDVLRVGQFAIAVGSPRGLEDSMSFGHVTALGRDQLNLPNIRFRGFIQTDAAINLGNSGGPLCNIDGEVIGINTAIVWGAQSLGFSIPVNRVKEIVPQLIADGKIVRGYLGVLLTDLPQAARDAGLSRVDEFVEALGLPDAKGASVVEVKADYPAERAGIEVFDVIREVNGDVVENADEIVKMITNMPPGATVSLQVWREGSPMKVKVKLDEYPGSLTKARLGKDVLGLRVRDASPDLLGRLGLDADASGVVVSDVETDSPADAAEILHGDVILKVAYEDVADSKSFRDLVRENAVPGESLLLRIARMGTAGSRTMLKVIKVPEDY